MTDTISFRPRLEQHGHQSGTLFTPFSTDLDTDPATIYPIPAGADYIQVYNFDLTFDSERGLPLEPNNFYTQSDQSKFFTMTLATTLTAKIATLSLAMEGLETPSVKAESPTETLLLSALSPMTIEDSISASSSFWVQNGFTFDLVIPIDFNTINSRPSGSTERDATITQFIKTTRWNGRIILHIENSGDSWSIKVDPNTFDTGFWAGQYVPFHTGWENFPASRGRPITDMRSGLPAFAQDLVEDGFVPGIWTSSENADPDDPRNIRQVEFPPNESTREDDVPV